MNKIFFIVVWLSVLTAKGWATDSEQKFQGFNLQGYSDSGTMEWEVNGDTADILGQDIKITNVSADIHGQQEMNIKADFGIINQTTGVLHLDQNVIITTDKGTQLLTNVLDWLRSEDLVETEDEIFILDKKFSLSGRGLKAHPSLKTGRVFKDITLRGNTEPEGSEPKYILVTSDGPLSIDQGKSLAVLENKVVAVQEDRTLEADRIELYFNQKTNQIKEVICIGHVIITQGENKTYAQRAIYNGEKQKLVLLGRPKVLLLSEGDNGASAFGN